MNPTATKALCVVFSVGLALAIGYPALASRFKPRDTVRLVDTRAEISDQFAQRDGTVSAPTEARLIRRLLRPKGVSAFWAVKFDKDRTVYDPDAYYWEQPEVSFPIYFKEHPDEHFLMRTNTLGFRCDHELQTERPDLRVLITGDSHTAGVLPNSENMAAVLESALSLKAPTKAIEVLNAGKPCYDFYNYAGLLGKFKDLQFDAYVVVVYGGNDFMASARLYGMFNGLAMPEYPKPEEMQTILSVAQKSPGFIPQILDQVAAFRRNPGATKLASSAGRSMLAEIQATCRERGLRFVLVYLPPCSDVQLEWLQPEWEQAVQALDLSPTDLSVSQALGDRLLEDAAALGIERIDLRPVYARETEPCYWKSDLHINTHGHALIAQQLETLFAADL